jgi:chemotaxis protein MotB
MATADPPLDADATPAAPPAAPPQPLPPPNARVSTQGGRYRRWHLDSRPEADEEGWLLTYLDVITLILVMMVVMLAFAGPPGSGSSAEGAQAASGQADAGTAPSPAAQASIVPPVPLPVPVAEPVNAAATEDPLAQLQQRVGNDIQVLRSDGLVRFRMSSELMFGSGDASLSAQGRAALDRLVPELAAEPGVRLIIEGHTDSVPIQSERFPSNWELSSGRAGAVARHLIERGVAPQRLQASGFADTRPLAARDNPVDRGLNRRVELVMEMPAPAMGR